jgi:cellulose synthase/poly-beta-1,6-N-acetylglucosamine synthase-like glycosyltransferase
MNFKINPTQAPEKKERITLRLMILVGLLSIVFLIYTLFQKEIISYYPLYVLLIITMLYYCSKYLHEWYHYFSITSPLIPFRKNNYTVDILTTYCAGEPFEMLKQTLVAVQNITYPHTTWCCDEADDPDVKKLCLQLGVKHVTRSDKTDAKAGNINNALQFATGELCVVLDPDHVPAPEFLDSIVNYFDDPSIGFVQIVQAYYNQTESLVAKGAAQQTYQFYGPMMMSMHTYGTVQALGANCTFRRAALDSIGGHANGLSEDMHTAMKLHAAGWRSVYFPAILTRGLVPATMSSYFKQQLKWSRGTWELLVSTYPGLFSKFTWRQRLHYFTLPFHYLSGLIFFINFLIPVICLFTGYIPLQMDIFSFLLATIPTFFIGILIRQYVQKWVSEEKERGFHVVGGFLQIGAWWIHTLGFFYTLLRKKVPYIPTPKNDKDSLPFLFAIPNLLLILISSSAIIYGLLHNINPYINFMVALAAMQIIILVFNLSISGYLRNYNKFKNVVMAVRSKSWLVTKTHGFLRTYSLSLSILVIILFVFAFRQKQKLPRYLPRTFMELQIFYKGLSFVTNQPTSRTDSIMAEARASSNISVISKEISWGAGETGKLDTASLNQVYKMQAIPMIAWKPWQYDSITGNKRDTAIMQHILTGRYDNSIVSFAKQLIQLNKPVFLCFINEYSQNSYPLFAYDSYTPEGFIAAWRYVYHLFEKAGAEKIIWVWNPPDAKKTMAYFPGSNYVDWLGVNIIDSSNKNFAALYGPYHKLPLFKSGFPVMLTKIAGPQVNTKYWWDESWKKINTDYDEIKSVVIDQSKYAVHKTADAEKGNINIKDILACAPKSYRPPILISPNQETLPAKTGTYSLPPFMKSVLYNKGYNWFRNKHTLEPDIIKNDIEAMKNIGINTVERTMPGIYDRNIIKTLISNDMNLIPRFWFLATSDVIANDLKMRNQKEKILSFIKQNADNKNIIAWNLGDDVLHNLTNQTFKPNYFFYREKYVDWLSDVCNSIRKYDSTRPIIMDLIWDINGQKQFDYYRKHVPQINTFMLTADVSYPEGLKKQLEKGMAWGKVPVELWPLLPAISTSGVVPAWQDLETTDYVKLNGLIDLEGRKKQLYTDVANQWSGKPIINASIPEIKILKPSKVTNTNDNLTYSILYKANDGRWRVFNDEEKTIQFEWYLVRLDRYGNTMFIKEAGKGPFLYLTVPAEPQYYKLYLEAIKGEKVRMVNSTLNTPFE